MADRCFPRGSYPGIVYGGLWTPRSVPFCILRTGGNSSTTGPLWQQPDKSPSTSAPGTVVQAYSMLYRCTVVKEPYLECSRSNLYSQVGRALL